MVTFALLPAVYLAWSSRDLPHLGYFHDDGLYLLGARSLAEGAGYRIPSLPTKPYQTKYPPMYPWLLSLVWRLAPVFPANLPMALAVTWVWLPVLLLLAGLFFRDLGFGRRHILLLVVILALNPVLAFVSMNLMADVMFAALVTATLVVAGWLERPGSHFSIALAAGLLASAAYLTKTAALPLLFIVPAVLLIRRRIGPACLFLCTALPAAIAWTAWSLIHRSSAVDSVTLYYTNYIGFLRVNVSWRDVPALFC